jgi:hypothetical protein
MNLLSFKETILLGCLIVLCYLAGFTVGEFNAYWNLAEERSRRALAQSARRSRLSENLDRETDGREKDGLASGS